MKMENGIVINSGSGETFTLELPGLPELEKILGSLCEAYCTSFSEGKKRTIRLLREYFPERYRKPLDKMSESDFFKLFFGIFQYYREGREKEQQKETQFCNEVIALAYLFKWRLEYAASIPAEVRRKCLECAGVKKENKEEKAPAPKEEEKDSSEELAQAITRTLEAIRSYKKMKKI